MKAILEILPVDVDTRKCTLVFELCNEGFSYAIKNDDENTWVGAGVFHIDKKDTAQEYSILLQNELGRQPILSGEFKKVGVMHSLGDNVLIPYSLYDSGQNENALNLIHGDLHDDTSILTDVITEKGIYNSYRVSANVLDIIRSKFPRAVSIHQHSVLSKQSPSEETLLSIIFYRKKMVVVLNKDNSIQFVNTFSFDTADDVMYILLNTCRQFELDTIPLMISGLLELNSSLSKLIHQYFNKVSFATLPVAAGYSEGFMKYPAHYISYIFDVDSCV